MAAQTTGQAGLLQLGSGITSLISSLGQLQAASIQAKQFKIQGTIDRLAASQEKLRAREQAVFLRKKFLQNIGSANASFAARGISAGSGVGRQLAIQGLRTLSEDIRAVELGSEAAQTTLQLRGVQTQFAAETAKNIGLLRFGTKGPKATSCLLTSFRAIRGPGKKTKEES